MSLEESQASKCIAHVDLDAFYAQVEVKRHPHLAGKPLGVVQYNPNGNLDTLKPEENRNFNSSNGSLIAVSYEARAHGVKRGMRGDEARRACAEVQLVQVPVAHSKADLTLYRAAGKQVADILARLAVTEHASIDECYLNITAEASRRMDACAGNPPLPAHVEQVHVSGQEGAAGWWRRPSEQWGPGERLLACGATVVADLRAAVREELGYSCSAGIAHNKILAKLASGLHKPAQQTVVCLAAVPGLLKDLPIPKLRQLGGKFGAEVCAALSISTVGELAALPLSRLESAVGEADGKWLHRLSRGVDDEEVKERQLPKSLSCGKTFRGRSALKELPAVHRWLLELGGELEERIAADRAANARIPRLLTVGMWGKGGPGTSGGSVSRSCPLQRPDAATLAADALKLIKRWAVEQPAGWGITSLYLSAANFVAAPTGSSTIMRFLTRPRGASPAASATSSAGHAPSASPPPRQVALEADGCQPGGAGHSPLAAEPGRQGGQPAHDSAGTQAQRGRPEDAVDSSTVQQAEDGLPASLEDWLAPPGAAAQPGAPAAAGDDGRRASGADAPSALGRQAAGAASASGRAPGSGPDAPLLVHFSEEDIDPEAWAALPAELRSELRLALLERSSSKQPARAKPGPGRQVPNAQAPPGKRARKTGGSAQITSFFTTSKPP